MAKRGLRAAVLLAVTATAAATVAATGTATPLETSCPTAFERLSVAWFEAQGPYVAPRRLDEAGNNNGYVCAFPFPDAVQDAQCLAGFTRACLLQALGLPNYNFNDDFITDGNAAGA